MTGWAGIVTQDEVGRSRTKNRPNESLDGSETAKCIKLTDVLSFMESYANIRCTGNSGKWGNAEGV